MADQQQSTPSQQRTVTEDYMGADGDDRTQSQFDTTFLQQITNTPVADQGVDWAREYFDVIEQQVRSARRVAELSALRSIRQQIIADAARLASQQVLTSLAQSRTAAPRGGGQGQQTDHR